MPSWKYVTGLLIIISIVWITMLFCLLAIYSILPSMGQFSPTRIDVLLRASFQLLVAGFILLIWLYSWNVLVKFYFKRNLNQYVQKPKELGVKKKAKQR